VKHAVLATTTLVCMSASRGRLVGMGDNEHGLSSEDAAESGALDDSSEGAKDDEATEGSTGASSTDRPTEMEKP
jgi:hypothetical protein